VKGPPASRAYDAAGQPTRAAEGFAQSKGMSVSDLQTRVMDGGVYLVALVKEVCRPAHEVLKEALPGLIEGIRFENQCAGITLMWHFHARCAGCSRCTTEPKSRSNSQA